MAKSILITQSNYIPWKGYFDAIDSVDEFVIYDDMQYTKNDWRNRNKIKTPNGTQWLTIPIEISNRHFQKINEMSVSEQHFDWYKKHWLSICHNYAGSTHFRDYKDIFEELYLNCTERNLSKINFRFLKAICNLMNIQTKFHWSHEFELHAERSERLLNICLSLNATHYVSQPAAKAYLNERIFFEHGIEIKWLDYGGYPEYAQLYPPFAHEVSIVDLLFNCGTAFKKYMKSNKNR